MVSRDPISNDFGIQSRAGLNAAVTATNPNGAIMQQLSLSPECVMDTVTKITELIPTGNSANRRIDSRELLVLPVEIQPLNDDLECGGEPLVGTSRNVSMGGIGFSTVERFDTPLALIHFLVDGEPEHSLIVRVCHRRFVGPLFEVGGQFLVDWTEDEYPSTFDE